MNLLEKKIIYKLSVIIFHFFLSDSIYGSEGSSFLDDLFGSSPKSPQKLSPSPVITSSDNSQSPILQPSHSQSYRPQETINEQTNQQIATFLQEFPKILKDMKELERNIPTLIPEHPRNLKNLRNSSKSGDWRVLMAWPVEPDLSERIKKMLENVKILKEKKRLEDAEKLKKEKILEDAEKLKKEKILEHAENLKKKKAVKKGKDKKSELQASDLKDTEAKDEVLTAIHVWFMKTCNPSRPLLGKFSHDFSHFSEWWAGLPLQFKTSQDVQALYVLLKEGNNTIMILNRLNELLVQSLLLKSQSLYEQLLPTFLDLKAASRTLKNLKEEALREDNQLKRILQSKELYKKIEIHIAQTIDSAVKPLLEDCLKETTDESLKQSVRDAFQQGMTDALLDKADPLPKRGLEKSQESISIQEIPYEIPKENLVKIIKGVIRKTITDGLNQATGRLNRDEEALVADITPITQTLRDFIKPSEKTSARSWYWWGSTKTSISPNLIKIIIPSEIQRQWEIPPYRSVKKSKKSLPKFSKISDITPICRDLFKEILSLRDYRHTPAHLQHLSLQEFLAQNKIVHLLFDFPRAYAHTPGIGGAELLPKILGFFEQFAGLITSYQRNLQKADGCDFGIYLDPERPSLNRCRSDKGPFFQAFPLLEPTELKSDWVSLEVINLFDRKFLNDEEKRSFRAELEENVFFLSMVDGLPCESLDINTLGITRLMENVKRVLFFKQKCEAIIADKSVSSEKDYQEIFQEKCNAAIGVKDAIKRMLIRQETEEKNEDDAFRKDRNLLIPFFTEFFRDTLTKCLYAFGLTPEKLEDLKLLSSPLPQKSEFDKAGSSSLIQSILSSQEKGQVTLHVPVNFREVEPSLQSREVLQHQSGEDADLPPVRVLDLEVGDLFSQ